VLSDRNAISLLTSSSFSDPGAFGIADIEPKCGYTPGAIKYD